jgi:hypothetical protein
VGSVGGSVAQFKLLQSIASQTDGKLNGIIHAVQNGKFEDSIAPCPFRTALLRPSSSSAGIASFVNVTRPTLKALPISESCWFQKIDRVDHQLVSRVTFLSANYNRRDFGPGPRAIGKQRGRGINVRSEPNTVLNISAADLSINSSWPTEHQMQIQTMLNYSCNPSRGGKLVEPRDVIMQHFLLGRFC